VFNNSFSKIVWLWNNVEKYCRAQQATDDQWRMCTACWKPRLQTHTHICNTAFPLQQWLLERTSMLRYTYTDCLLHVNFYNIFVHYLQCFEFKSNVNAKYIILIYKTRCTTHISWPHSANNPHSINNCLYHIIFILKVRLLNIKFIYCYIYCKWKNYVYHITLLMILVLFKHINNKELQTCTNELCDVCLSTLYNLSTDEKLMKFDTMKFHHTWWHINFG
jgi:hypothetical protein